MNHAKSGKTTGISTYFWKGSPVARTSLAIQTATSVAVGMDGLVDEATGRFAGSEHLDEVPLVAIPPAEPPSNLDTVSNYVLLRLFGISPSKVARAGSIPA